MKTEELKKTAQDLSTSLRRTPAGEPLGPLVPKLLRLIARGRPTTAEEIASATGATVEVIEAMIRSMPDAETDDDGNLVGMGLTLRETVHRFTIEGRQLYTWCALDTLMYPSLLDASAVIESPCRATGDPIRVEVGPDGVGSVEPEAAVVSIVLPEACSSIRSEFCNEVHFFRSEDVARMWLAAHPGAIVLPVSEAFELAKFVNEATIPAQ